MRMRMRMRSAARLERWWKSPFDEWLRLSEARSPSYRHASNGNKRRGERGGLGGKLVFVIRNERSFEHDDDWSIRCLRPYCDRRSESWRYCK